MKDFTWVIIYVVIMVVGFLAKQAKRQQVKQPQAKQSSPRQPQPKTARPVSQNVSAKFEQYFTQLEKAFTTPQPPALPHQAQHVAPILAELPDEEDLISDERPRKRPFAKRAVAERAYHVQDEVGLSDSASLVRLKPQWHLVQGIVMAEVLGPPVSKRHGRGRRG